MNKEEIQNKYIDLRQGDCLEIMKDIPDKSIDLIVTDPPYQFRKEDNGGGGMLNTRKYDKEIHTKLGSTNILDCGITEDFLEETKRLFKKGYNAVYFCNQQQLKMYIDFADKNKYRFNILVWNKTNPTPLCNNKYLDDLEFQVQIKSKDYKIGGNYKTKSKCYISQINKKDKQLYEHPTIKPLDLVEKFIINHSNENDIILDPFMGSGTTGVACINTNRNFIGIELNEKYFNIAKERIEKAQNKWDDLD